MQNISFGRVLKVNAPSYVADRIVTMAQRKELPTDKKTSTLLGNCNNAHTYSFGDNENESYIFTGKDGDRYWHSFSQAWDTMEYAKQYYHGDDDFANPHIEDAWDRYRKSVEEIINSADKIHELDVQYNEDKTYNQVEVKSLNIIA